MEKTAIHSLSIKDLEEVLSRYPWYSIARKELFLRLSSMGDEYLKEGLKKAAVYVFSREGLIKESKLMQREIEKTKVEEKQPIQVVEKVFKLDDDIENIEDLVVPEPVPTEPVKPQEFVIEEDDEEDDPKEVFEKAGKEKEMIQKVPEREIRIIGGDYFGKEDLASLQRDGMSAIERITTLAPVCSVREEISLEEAADFTDETYYTETLAKVYAQQGLYKKAIEVYSKLILLYPEKSTYFAALIDELKKYL